MGKPPAGGEVQTGLLGVDPHTGSIRTDETADLRQTRIVMIAGKLLNAEELRGAARVRSRPK